MSLKERLHEDWKQALKAKDKFKATTISMARAAILLKEKTDGSVLEDEQVIGIISKQVKQGHESILEFEKGNRQDLVDQSNAEIEILLSYLPQQLSEKEITEIVRQSIDEVQAKSMKDMRSLMSVLGPKTKGKADGKLVNQIVKQFLNS
jgi:uncharacterized protein YqeY